MTEYCEWCEAELHGGKYEVIVYVETNTGMLEEERTTLCSSCLDAYPDQEER